MIPKKLRQEMSEDVYYKTCSRKNVECDGRITWEHAMTYAGKQIQEKWAIIPLCEYHHSIGKYLGSGNLNKRENRRIALSRATEEDLKKYPKLTALKN